jgi:hypothetical protein
MDRIAITGIRVYPNPVTDLAIVNLNSAIEQTITITLVDVAGKKARELNSRLSKGDNKIQLTELRHLQKGIYILKVVTEDGITTHKVLKD